jgi:hypothetical protein
MDLRLVLSEFALGVTVCRARRLSNSIGVCFARLVSGRFIHSGWHFAPVLCGTGFVKSIRAHLRGA